jgi:hypothetical protein
MTGHALDSGPALPGLCVACFKVPFSLNGSIGIQDRQRLTEILNVAYVASMVLSAAAGCSQEPKRKMEE